MSPGPVVDPAAEAETQQPLPTSDETEKTKTQHQVLFDPVIFCFLLLVISIRPSHLYSLCFLFALTM